MEGVSTEGLPEVDQFEVEYRQVSWRVSELLLDDYPAEHSLDIVLEGVSAAVLERIAENLKSDGKISAGSAMLREKYREVIRKFVVNI